MNVLAIDASTKSSGIAIFEDNKLIKYDCLTASSTDVIKRIQKITNAIEEVMNQYPIDQIILEEVRPDEDAPQTKNVQTHRVLMWLQASINFMAHDKFPKVKFEYVYPNEWRKACGIRVGRGIKRVSLKPADIKFVKDTYNIDVNDDVADAIGIGHAYVNQLNNEINWE